MESAAENQKCAKADFNLPAPVGPVVFQESPRPPDAAAMNPKMLQNALDANTTDESEGRGISKDKNSPAQEAQGCCIYRP